MIYKKWNIYYFMKEVKMKTLKKVFFLIIVVMFSFFVIGIILHISNYEGIDGFIFKILYPRDDTLYGDRYIESNFRRIQIGDTKAQVLSLIGYPLSEKKVADSIIWYYSKSPSSTHFHLRIIHFSKEWRVIHIDHEYYID